MGENIIYIITKYCHPAISFFFFFFFTILTLTVNGATFSG